MLTATLDTAPFLERCFLFDAVEDSYEVSGVQGRVPEWLRGSYYVNGPAAFERAGRRYRHWLDGDGMVCALHFSDEGVHFANRFVNTPKRRDEDRAGGFIYRGFGTAFTGDRLRRNVMLEPPANVSAYPFDGRLLAFGEQAIPFDLDPITLETRGEYDFNGSLNELSPFAAHAKIDPSNGHLLNFGISFSATHPVLNYYEFDSSGRQLRRRRYGLTLQHSNHDFGYTPHHVIFYLSPLIMDFRRFWNEGASVLESLEWRPERGSRILVMPRESKLEAPFEIQVGSKYCLHFINCFEEGTLLNVDVLELAEPVYSQYQPVPDLFATVAPCHPVRYQIDRETRALLERMELTYDRTPDFPAVDGTLAGRDYEDFWMLGISAAGSSGRKFFDQLAHGSWRGEGVRDIYTVPRGQYLSGEPMFVANANQPDEAVIILQHLEPARDAAAFLIFDAFAVGQGPLARLPLRHRLHPGFHSSFARTGGLQR